MVPFRILTALASLAALSACFYSEVPLIPPGEQVNLPYDGVVLCLADDCRNVMVGEDGVYTTISSPIFARAQPHMCQPTSSRCPRAMTPRLRC